ncbi:P-loop containing nucleoside triphosphate hydrolase protein [Heliocybe sulcata]|uniref:DNA 3'-5' helicase n=1 Tax=Heliocybe sulcata TaxID=5364 RepID=A0A5C3MJG7_9AGAM|nr:P-loop containing nucleoside triphosphate hydrolase protein [Heliocybe sulcata]
MRDAVPNKDLARDLPDAVAETLKSSVLATALGSGSLYPCFLLILYFVTNTMDVPMEDSSAVEVGSREWYRTVVARALNYAQLKDFQTDLALEIQAGKDVGALARCGEGKSALFLAPLMALKLKGMCALEILIVPTKALSEDQAKSANARNLRALAINRGTLFSEVEQGLWDLVIMSPEMLKSEHFRKKLDSKKFRNLIRLVGVDEFHLIHEHGEEFRSCYRDIGEFRARLADTVRFIAVTATPPTGQALWKVLGSLRFKEPIGLTKYDIAWMVPMSARTPADIPKAIVFCETIKEGHAVLDFLESLLPNDLPDHDEIIMPFNSVLSAGYRHTCMDNLRSGKHRIIVASESFTYGVDVSDIEYVVIFGLARSLSRMVQEIGRTARNGFQGYAVTYAPRWVRDVPQDEWKNNKSQIADKKRREEMSQVTRAWFNASAKLCPRGVLCQHYDDVLVIPEHCCIFHEPDSSHEQEVARHVASMEPQDDKPSKSMRSDGTHLTLDKDMMFPAARRMIDSWAVRRWIAHRGSRTHIPATFFFPNFLRERLCKKLHLVTDLERLQALLHDWEEFPNHGKALFEYVDKILDSFDDIAADRKLKVEVAILDKRTEGTKIANRKVTKATSGDAVSSGAQTEPTAGPSKLPKVLRLLIQEDQSDKKASPSSAGERKRVKAVLAEDSLAKKPATRAKAVRGEDGTLKEPATRARTRAKGKENAGAVTQGDTKCRRRRVQKK